MTDPANGVGLRAKMHRLRNLADPTERAILDDLIALWAAPAAEPVPLTLDALTPKAREVVNGHQERNFVCSECAMTFPCHAWLLADEILRIRATPALPADEKAAALLGAIPVDTQEGRKQQIEGIVDRFVERHGDELAAMDD